VIRHSINERCPAAARAQAHAFREQAHDYFKAADVAGLFTAKPVLLYYSFLNLAKAYVLTVGGRPEYGAAFHGLKERLPTGGTELLQSTLEAIPTGANVNIFDDFLSSIRSVGLASNVTYAMPKILPQILQGHRLWCSASSETERFVEVARIDLMQQSVGRQIWLVLNFFEDDLTRLSLARNALLRSSGMHGNFREVASTESVSGRHLIKYEQVSPVTYSHRASDKIPELVNSVKHDLWSNVLSVPPYRKYYVYAAPSADKPFILPQLLSIFSLFYYLGSVTRYKPQKISGLLSGDYGAQLEECVVNLPNQFLYLLATEFARQEVSRAAIV